MKWKMCLAAVAAAWAAGAATLSVEPATFTVARDGLENQYAVLSWTLPAGVSETVVYRAYGEGGPWAEVADVSGAATWTDTTAPLGVPCYYKLAFAETTPAEADADGGDAQTVRTLGDPCAATVVHRRAALLERDWSDMTKVKDGVTVVWNSKGKIYNNGNGVTRASIVESVADAFDGETATHPNVGKGTISGRPGIGVDLGARHVLGFVRCWPRTNNASQRNAFNGHLYYGSNDAATRFSTDDPAVTEAAVLDTQRWYELAATNSTPYSCFYAYNPSNDGWCLGVCEIQFYGWPVSAYENYPVGASGLTASLVSDGVALAWTDNGYNTAFTVERRANGGDWTTLTTAQTGTAYVDTTVVYNGTTYEYRITTVCGEAVSYSAPTAIRLTYPPADGTGLHTVYTFPVIPNVFTESVTRTAVTGVDIAPATLADARALVPGVANSHTNVLIAWNGTLVAPFAGDYTFTAVADGTVSLWIDDENVLRHDATSTDGATGAKTLTAGEHAIRVVYWQGASSTGCVLKWGGAVAEETIPLTQLKPVAPTALPSDWEGARTFGTLATTLMPSDIRANDDGTLDFAYAGSDCRDGQWTSGYAYAWRQLSGDFSFTTKVTYRPGSKVAGEKAGLMLRAGLDEAAPFEAFFVRSNTPDLGLRARRAVGGTITEPKTVAALGSQTAWKIRLSNYNPVYLRLKRTGNHLSFAYRTATTDAWTEIYTYDDTAGLYGRTVYVGFAASNVVHDSWETAAYRRARYAWRFSETTAVPVEGLKVILR